MEFVEMEGVEYWREKEVLVEKGAFVNVFAESCAPTLGYQGVAKGG